MKRFSFFTVKGPRKEGGGWGGVSGRVFTKNPRREGGVGRVSAGNLVGAPLTVNKKKPFAMETPFFFCKEFLEKNWSFLSSFPGNSDSRKNLGVWQKSNPLEKSLGRRNWNRQNCFSWTETGTSTVPVLNCAETQKAPFLTQWMSQRALRDTLMSRGKNWLPTVSRQFLTRNYPRPNCLLKCLQNCLSPTREGIFPLSKFPPRWGQLRDNWETKIASRQFLPRDIKVSLLAHWERVVFQKGGFGGSSPGTKTGTRVHSDVPPERKPEQKVHSHVPPKRKPKRGHIRQNQPLTKPPFSPCEY